MPGQAQQTVSEFVFETVHDRQNDNQRRDAERDADDRRDADERCKAIGALGAQVTQAHEYRDRPNHGRLHHFIILVHSTGRIPEIEGIVKSAPVYLGEINMVRRVHFILLAAMVLSAPVAASADTLIIEGIEKSDATVSVRPNRGQTMNKVEATWGQPESKQSPVVSLLSSRLHTPDPRQRE